MMKALWVEKEKMVDEKFTVRQSPVKIGKESRFLDGTAPGGTA
jgi:hypothetical protein